MWRQSNTEGSSTGWHGVMTRSCPERCSNSTGGGASGSNAQQVDHQHVSSYVYKRYFILYYKIYIIFILHYLYIILYLFYIKVMHHTFSIYKYSSFLVGLKTRKETGRGSLCY